MPMFLILAAQAVVAPSPSVPLAPDFEPQIVQYLPGEVRCGGVQVAAVQTALPLPIGTFLGEQKAPAYTLNFRIAADGRPLGIGQPERSGEPRAGFVSPEDLGPTLAAFRFAPGAERARCTITFAPDVAPVSSAPRPMLYRFLALPRLGSPGWREAGKRVHDESPGCFVPRTPAVRLRAFPDFEAIPQPAGTNAYTMVGYDIDARGRPRHVTTLTSDGNVALDRAAVKAIARSRYAPGARTGCNYPFYRRQDTPMPAPPVPDRDAFRESGANCDNEVAFAKRPTLTFPEPFRRRAIEGWAVIAYDVAPWGELGNIRVLAAEPAAAFGEQARQIVSTATRPPSTTGAVGCVDRVVFKMPDDDRAAAAADQ